MIMLLLRSVRHDLELSSFEVFACLRVLCTPAKVAGAVHSFEHLRSLWGRWITGPLCSTKERVSP